MIQRYATGSGGILSLSPAPWFKIFRMGWMQCEVEGQPKDLGIPHKPHAEEKGNRDHDGQRDGGITDCQQIVKHRPRAKRGDNRECVADRNVRQEISAFAHEEKSAAWTANWTIKISAKQFSFTTNRTSQTQQRSKLHTFILTNGMSPQRHRRHGEIPERAKFSELAIRRLAPADILHLCQTTVLMWCPL